jgi:hypothetical protein
VSDQQWIAFLFIVVSINVWGMFLGVVLIQRLDRIEAILLKLSESK